MKWVIALPSQPGNVEPHNKEYTEPVEGISSHGEWNPPVNLEDNNFNEHQKQEIRLVRREERNAYSHDDDDIGCVPGLRHGLQGE